MSRDLAWLPAAPNKTKQINHVEKSPCGRHPLFRALSRKSCCSDVGVFDGLHPRCQVCMEDWVRSAQCCAPTPVL